MVTGAPNSEQEGLKIVVKCVECEKEHLLFDQAIHGYDGLIWNFHS